MEVKSFKTFYLLTPQREKLCPPFFKCHTGDGINGGTAVFLFFVVEHKYKCFKQNLPVSGSTG